MSIKVHTAYQLRPGHDLWETLHDIRERAETNARKALRKLYEAIQHDIKKPVDERSIIVDQTLRQSDFTLSDVSRFVHERYGEAAQKMTCDFYDLDVSLVVRRAGRRRFLLIPYPGSGALHGTLDFLRRHKALVDYHYQNNSDRPSHIRVKDWDERDRTWSKVLADDRLYDKLVLEIVSYANFFRLDPLYDGLYRKRRAWLR